MRFAVAALAFVASVALAQSPHRDLYLYKGADRDQRVLRRGAEGEARAFIYTSLNLQGLGADRPGVQEEVRRRDRALALEQREVLQRALTSIRAGRFAVDGFELNGPEMEALYREGLLRSSTARRSSTSRRRRSPSTRHYNRRPAEISSPSPYNTKLVKAARSAEFL